MSATDLGAADPGAADRLPQTPAVEIVRRRPPRVDGGPLPAVGDGPRRYIDALLAALRGIDGSYVAVQGPPGTGKTYVGSHVVAELVAGGWRVGVVAQSHAVVANFLQKVVSAGVSPAQVAKKLPAGAKPDPEVPWRELDGKGLAAHAAAGPGVVGGTAWDFANETSYAESCLDLLVIDEAGQFSLANTVAVGRSARRLLLLGDPQQLPQVTQGQHPEPVDVSALSHLAGDHAVLPGELGYFLETTWRMHPEVTAPVSRLSYDGRLRAEAAAAGRSLTGVEPGVGCVRVEHTGNVQSSAEEAEEVVRQVRAVVGRTWDDGKTEPAEGATDPERPPVGRPLEAADILVVAAYNAQVGVVQDALDRAGLAAVRVGTVDKFQGQEAPVAILTTAASSPAEVPRGMGFLLSRNRINVAVSRAQWRAVVVRSDRLTDYLPATPDELAELGAFIALCAGDA
ncbi:DEAD/DEAH box helicase [Paraoerskovia sediminicola]|uniref:DEAD/DEAH box helicase n=1 Tax=Paraoerskovia sediminicola TaxID=1138587 RepID=UPI00330682EA